MYDVWTTEEKNVLREHYARPVPHPSCATFVFGIFCFVVVFLMTRWLVTHLLSV